MIDEIRKIHAHNTLDLCIQTNISTWYLLDQFNMNILADILAEKIGKKVFERRRAVKE